jgi:hypothetical protein
MSDSPQSGTVPPQGTATQVAVPHPPFPVVRLLYAILFAALLGVALWLVCAAALIQFIVYAINGKVNDELKGFTASLAQYMWELATFITFVRDDQPFPMGPFPKSHGSDTH